jgi:hypothetical protein
MVIWKQLNDSVLPYIRFPTLTSQEIFDYVEKSKVVDRQLLLEAYRSNKMNFNTSACIE